MAEQRGKAYVIKAEDTPGGGSYTTIAGLRTTTMSINNEQVDITTKDSGSWRELLDDAGLRSISVSGAGIFKDTASEKVIRDGAMNGSILNFEVVFEDGAKFAGAFQITSLEYSGEHVGVRQYSMTLESSGTVSYTDA